MATFPPLPRIQRELVIPLLKQGVDFLVIGGTAVKAHGVARDPHDLDILLSPERDSREALARLFSRFQERPRPGETWLEAVSRPNVRFAYPDDSRKAADLLTSIEGIDYAACRVRSVSIEFGYQKLRVASVADLIAMKEESMRTGNAPEALEKDAADIAALRTLL